MSDATGWMKIATEFAGSLLGLVLYSVAIVALVAFQIYEYRKSWQHRRRSWWLIKAATPLLVIGLLASTMLFFDTSGMEGLAIFFAGAFASLLAAPLLLVGLARKLGVPAMDTLSASVSLLASLFIGWFAIAGIQNSAQGINSYDVDERAEYLAFRHAADNAGSTNDEIVLAAQHAYLLPDGQLLIHLEFHIAPNFRIQSIDVRIPDVGGQGRWSSTQGTCATPGSLHITSVLNIAEQIDVRLRFHSGTPSSMVEFKGEFPFPQKNRDVIPPLQLRYEGGQLSTPVPMPAHLIRLSLGNDVAQLLVDHVPLPDAPLVMHENSRCFAESISVGDGIEQVNAQLYSDERSRKLLYSIPLISNQ